MSVTLYSWFEMFFTLFVDYLQAPVVMLSGFDPEAESGLESKTEPESESRATVPEVEAEADSVL